MSKNTTVSITLQLKGTAGKDLSRISADQIKQTQKINANWNMATTAQAKFTDQVRKSTTETKNTNVAGEQLLRTNRLLEGVLRQQAIQTRLQSSQLKAQARDYTLQTRMLSEQARHARELQRAMAAAARSQRDMRNDGAATGAGWGGRASGMMMGAAAAYGVVRTPLERARSFETKIFDATTSITSGYQNMSHNQAKAANLTLAQYAKDAVRQGHGSVEGVGDAAGILAASGLYRSIDELKEPLRAIAKTAFANGAAEQDVALLTQQIRQFGVVPDRTQVALDRAATSGFLGGFELKDMARLLPEVLPFAKTAGYSGEKGLNQVTTHMQLARKYTGLPSQAADNMRDLYSLFSQNHFALSIGKYIKPEKGDPIRKIGLRGNRMGFDVNSYLATQKEQGVDPVTAIVALMNRQLSKNKRFTGLQKQIQTAEKSGNTDQATTYKKEASQIVAAGEFGKIFHNQQSLSGLMSIIAGLNNGDFERISTGSWQGVGANERVAKEKAQIEPAQAHTREQEAILATIKIYDSVKESLGKFEAGLTDAMQANQALTAAAYAAAAALAVFTAASVGSRLAGAGAAAAAGGGLAAKGAGWAAVLGAGYMGGTMLRDWYTTTETGQGFDNGVGKGIAEVLAFFGNETAQQTLETNDRLDKMIQINEQQLEQARLAANKKLIAEIGGKDLLFSMDDAMNQQSNRGFPYRP